MDVLAQEGSSHPYQLRHLSYGHMMHALTLTRFVCAAQYWCRTHAAYALSQEILSYALAQNPPTVPLEGHTKSVTVVPDAWMLFERVTDGQGTPIWLEVDRGSEYRAKFQQLVRDRLAFLKSEQYCRYFGTRAVLLCYATTGSTPEYCFTRLHTMRRWTQEVLAEQALEDWASVFRFTTLEYEKMYDHTHRLFSESVWHRPDDPSPVPLLTSSNPQLPQEKLYEHDDPTE